MPYLNFLNDLLPILRKANADFKNNDPLKFGAAIAFFSTFALPPISIIIIWLLGRVFKVENINADVIEYLSQLFGSGGAGQVQMVLENMKMLQTNFLFTVFGSIFLVFVSTTLFVVVQNSLNQLWAVRPKPLKRIRLRLKNRFIALVLILLTSVLFLFSLFADYTIDYLGDNLSLFFPSQEMFFVRSANIALSIIVVTIWFGFLFKLLPDVQIPWHPVWVGGLFTAILFIVGRSLLHRFLIHSQLGTIYEASASVILIMLFIFYAAMLFFYGAAFTKAYATRSGIIILPKPYAVTYQLVVIEQEDQAIT